MSAKAVVVTLLSQARMVVFPLVAAKSALKGFRVTSNCTTRDETKLIIPRNSLSLRWVVGQGKSCTARSL